MAVSYHDYYELLEVGREATEKEIKSAYRRLARKWHPDLRPAAEKKEAEEKFKLINEAYEVLKDPEKRARYDRLGSNWQEGQDFRPPPDMEGVRFYTDEDLRRGFGSGFSDFFEMFFGAAPAGRGTAPRQEAVRGKDLESTLELTLEEAYRGTTKAVRVSGGALCPECGGTTVSGRSICRRCAGAGSISSERTLEVKIPPGVQEGSRIRLKNQGGEGLGSAPRGDLFLKVRLLSHPVFKLKGSDLETEIVIRPEQAVLGDRVSVQTLDGPVTVSVPAGTRRDKRLRLRGKGFPTKVKGRGDQYVRVAIDIPEQLGEREKELYRRLREIARGGE